MSVAKRLAVRRRRDVLAPDRERSPTGRPRADRRRERRVLAALEAAEVQVDWAETDADTFSVADVERARQHRDDLRRAVQGTLFPAILEETKP